LKILFITAWYPTRENPVSGIFVREHAKALSIIGDEVVVIHSERSRTHIEGLDKVSEMIEEGIRTLRISYFPSPFRSFNYLLYLRGILRISSRLIQTGFRPEVIHAHIFSAGVPAVILGRLFRIPVVVTEHWHGFPQKKLKLSEKITAKIAMNRARWILPVSRSLQRGIEAYGIRGRFQIVPNVVDTALFYPASKVQKNDNQKRFLFVGSLKPMKGLPFLFQALARLHTMEGSWQLDIVGDGPGRQEYEELAAASGLAGKVTFYGLKSKPDVAEFMRRADFLVLPSLWENMPCVLLEAMASGLPIVSTRTGGIPEIVDQESGVLVPPGDSNSLAEALLEMIESLARFDRAAISKKAERYRPEAVGRLIHSVYEGCACE
jgi:glycosyltransferase involved in cell wall biosynthesis